MNVSASAVYGRGRIAGGNHYFSLRRDPAAKLPKSSRSEGAEWDRGFIDGFAQGKRGGSPNRMSAGDRRKTGTDRRYTAFGVSLVKSSIRVHYANSRRPALA